MDKNMMIDIEKILSEELAKEIDKSIIKELMRYEEERLKKVKERNQKIDDIIN
jgi:4'-phosphopantetheinyl transferase EntD